MTRHYPETLWCRYADDGLAHCDTKEQAESLLETLRQRFNECGLEFHPDKTKIVYCKDDNRRERHPKTRLYEKSPPPKPRGEDRGAHKDLDGYESERDRAAV